ncbi:hypothetical protein Tsubulata_051278 [Turnera subulata]|uniref:Acyl-coenzyme A oxidase n=1 Tax=Turnera subulata TaxID=218843 RepID=A0A9Q0FVL2_9ROSI|nr:hypothetical protein Tsubulata_051278 [Turnera subulata]
MSLHHRNAPLPAGTATRRAGILASHFILHDHHHLHHAKAAQSLPSNDNMVHSNACFSFSSPAGEEITFVFDTKEMRSLLDRHNIAERDWLFGLMQGGGEVFNRVEKGGRVYVSPDYNQPMQQQREMTMRRIRWLLDRGVFKGWCMDTGVEADLRNLAMQETLRSYDHSLGIYTAVHFFLWGGAVRGIETTATYDSSTGEFIINTPRESAQKYWIGGAAIYSTHAAVFSQLNIGGINQGVHVFVVQIRDADGNLCPNIRTADCGRKIGLNGVDNGQIWFDNVRIPRENLLNAIADVSPDGQYLSQKDPEQRFAAFLASLTVGRVAIATSAIYSAKMGLTIAIRHALSRRAFSLTPNGPEVLLLDYPSHQRRLFPLLAKTYAMNFAGNDLKMIYAKRKPENYKTLHVVSSTFKAMFTWHNMRTLQECREACGGQGVKVENRIGQMIAEFDVQSTFEGDNNVLMQRVSKEVLAEFLAAKKHNKLLSRLGLEHINEPCPVIPSQLTSAILRSSQFQINAFRLRERDLLNLFAAKVSENQQKGQSKEYAHYQAYQLSKDLGRAFSDRMVLQSAVAVEESISAGSLKNVLGLVRSMYALSCMEEDDAFLRYGYISRQNAGAIREEVEKLCSEMRPHALALVSSFGFPDSFLGPIAFDWIEANSWSSV